MIQGVRLESPQITLKELEDLIDSSLRVADDVKSGDDVVKGELSYIRDVRWLYLPYRFRAAYRVLEGQLSIMFFQYQRAGGRWQSLKSTDHYKQVLREADVARLAFLRR